ncbi:MAG: transposase [Bacteroidota bacterium]
MEDHDVENMKSWNGGGGFSVNGQTLLRLTSLELIDKLAALVPPPRIHRHRYYGVLAPNSPFRASVTAMAGLSLAHGAIEVQSSDDKEEEPIEQEQDNKPKRPPNRYLWAMLLARIYNLFPLLCPECGTEMQVIAVIQDKPVINKILESVGEMTEPPVLRPSEVPLGYHLHEGHQVGMSITRMSFLTRMNSLYPTMSLISVFPGENE